MLLYLIIRKLIFNTVMFSYFSKYLIVCLFKFYVGKLTLITKLISGQVTDWCSVLFFQWKSDSAKPLWKEVNKVSGLCCRQNAQFQNSEYVSIIYYNKAPSSLILLKSPDGKQNINFVQP